MKKFLFVFLVVIIVLITFQKFRLTNFFLEKPTSKSEKQSIKVPSLNISQAVNRPILGIHYRMINAQTALENKLIAGAYITQIIKDSPAEKANLQEEDILTEIDGRRISDLDERSLYKLISTLKPGSKISLTVWRNEEIKTFSIALK